MIKVNPLTEVSLGHRAFHVAVAESGHVVAFSSEGTGTLLGPDSSRIRVQFPSVLKDVAISANGERLAVVNGTALHVLEMPTFREIQRLEGAFETALFNDAELWYVVRLSESVVAVEVRNAVAWEALARVEIEDPFGGSHFTFVLHPDKKHVVIWVAAGQDGQRIFLARRKGSDIHVSGFSTLENTTPPSFSELGDRFLVLCDGSELRHYEFPGGQLVAKVELPFYQEDDETGEIVTYAGANNAMLSSSSGRLYFVNLREMTVADELNILGHESKPVRTLYPTLTELGLCSDLSFFLPFPGGRFLSVHRELPSPSPLAWRDRLLTWRAPVSATARRDLSPVV